jgi:hypothetical protein
MGHGIKRKLRMLYTLDIFLTILHLCVLLFNLFGWIWPKTRKAHLVVVLITAFCWLVLGIWYGIGYCPITDWQWQVKEKMGVHNLPNSFVTYCLYGMGLKNIPPAMVDVFTGVSFATAGFLALYFNFFRSWIRRLRTA